MLKDVINYINNKGRFISSDNLILNSLFFHISSYISVINPYIDYKDKLISINYFGISIASSGSGKSFVYNTIKNEFDTIKWEQAVKYSYEQTNKELPNNELQIDGISVSLRDFLPNYENNIEGTKEGLYLRALALSKCFVGSLNIINEEIMDIINNSNINVMKELYDGQLLGKVIKGSINENIYNIRANMLIFGSSIGLKRDNKTYESFVKSLNSGIYRRSFIYYEEPKDIIVNNSTDTGSFNIDNIISLIQSNRETLNNGLPFILNFDKNALELLETINNDLIIFANEFKEDERFSAEIGSFDKIIKLSGIISIWFGSSIIKKEYLEYAYEFYRELRDTNKNLFNVEPQHKRIYKILKSNKKLTKSEILEKDIFNRITFNEDINLIEELCYRNNERLIVSGNKIKFYSIEQMQETNLNKIIISIPEIDKKERTTQYKSMELPLFGSKMCIESLIKSNVSNFCLVHFKNGKRKKDNVIERTNCIGLDIDFGSLDDTLYLLNGFDLNYLVYTTKSHQKDKGGLISDRFRVLLPLKNIIDIDADRYEEMVENIADSINLNIYDKNAKDMSRLWFTNKEAIIYKKEDGILFDATPYMPDTKKSEHIENVGSNLELNSNDELERRIKGMIRWTISSCYQGNRNAMLLKLALFVYDLSGSKELAKDVVLETNQMISEPLNEKEIRHTIFKTLERK